MKMLLLCNQGMSTSALVRNMYKFVEEGVTIEAHAITEYKDIIQHYDVVLLGPQIRYKLYEVKQEGEKYGIPVAVIDPAAYGMLDGKKVVAQAYSLVNKK